MIEWLRAVDSRNNSSARHSAVACGAGRDQVLFWSAQRLVDLLRCRGRRPLQLGRPGSDSLTPQERTLSALFTAIDAGDHPAALAHAQWLVPTTEAKRLARWAQPVVESGVRARIAA